MFTKQKLFFIWAIAAVTVVVAGAAYAQTAGTYNGTSADGQAISLVVGTDGNGVLAVLSVNVGIALTCKPGTLTFTTGSGYGQDAVITNSKFNFIESFVYLYEPVQATFSGNTMTGTISSDVPALAPFTKGGPKKSVFCVSPKQAFTATLAATAKTAPHTAVYSVAR